jgi:hypothetical protein
MKKRDLQLPSGLLNMSSLFGIKNKGFECRKEKENIVDHVT